MLIKNPKFKVKHKIKLHFNNNKICFLLFKKIKFMEL